MQKSIIQHVPLKTPGHSSPALIFAIVIGWVKHPLALFFPPLFDTIESIFSIMKILSTFKTIWMLACLLNPSSIAASELDANAAFNLGYMYGSGDGLPRNDKKAVFWYEQAIEQGNTAASNNLGYIYENGYCVTKNLKKAIHHYRISANQGYSKSQHQLGFLYQFGKGVYKNPEIAAMWYEKAAKKGFSYSLMNLSHMYRKGEGVPQSKKRRINFLRKPIYSTKFNVY